MSLHKSTQNVLGNGVPFLLLLVIPALTWGGQKRNTPPQPSRPAPAGKPAHPASRPWVNTNRRSAGMSTQRPATTLQRPMNGTQPSTTNGARVDTANRAPLGTAGTASGAQPGKIYRGPTAAVTPSTRATVTPHPPPTTLKTFTDHSGHLASATFHPGGKIATIRANGMTISHQLHGARTIVATRNDRTIVNTGSRTGYVQRTYVVRNGTTYYQRTYVVDNVSYIAEYRGFFYHGYVYYSYVTAFYYGPAFYGWAFTPWLTAVYYDPAAWGWAGSPWYAYYGAYWAPYSVYPTASLWLTDYLIAANLQAAYQAQAEANADSGALVPSQQRAEVTSSQTQLSPQVKQMIAEEVKAQLASESAAAANNQQTAPMNYQQRILLGGRFRIKSSARVSVLGRRKRRWSAVHRQRSRRRCFRGQTNNRRTRLRLCQSNSPRQEEQAPW